jgi:hypothetical protein
MLNNFKIWLANFMFNAKGVSVSSSSGKGELFLPTINGEQVPIVAIDGTNLTTYNNYSTITKYMYALGYISNRDNQVGVTLHFGTDKDNTTSNGTYSLFSPCDSNVVFTNASSVVDFTDNGARLVISGTVTNGTDSVIEISEMGLVLNYSHYENSKSEHIKVLLDRKSVADGNFTPATVGAGESKIFVYAIEL